MGRRAKKAPVVTKKKVKLAKCFKCPFCANDNVVECKMDFRNGIGSLNCRLCGASYQMPIHHLHEPIDVFSEWLDDCEAAQNRAAGIDNGGISANGGTANGGTANGDTNGGVPQYDDDDDDEDNLPPSTGMQKGNKNSKVSAKNAKNNPSIDLGDADSDDDDDDDDM